ncbi:MAG: site-specific DNA-methyltransferase [bacterium]
MDNKRKLETPILGKNLSTVWQIRPEPHNFQRELGVNVDHFAAFPKALCEIPIKFGCPKNGIVLDPFMGTGTTAVVAYKLGRNWLGIELNPEYIKIANKRLEPLIRQNRLL